MLNLAEELTLLATNDEKGAVEASCAVALPFGLAGAVVLDLLRQERLVIDEETVRVVNPAPTGDPILDEALKSIDASTKPRKIEYWIALPEKLVELLHERLLDSLVKKGVLKREERRFLWLIPYSRYPVCDGRPEKDIRSQLRDVILDGAKPDAHVSLLLCLIHACGLAREVFPNEHPEQIATRLKEFAESNRVTKAVADNVLSVTMSMVAAGIAASTIAMNSTMYNNS